MIQTYSYLKKKIKIISLVFNIRMSEFHHRGKSVS